jgi:hypothetical protein
MKDEHSLNQEEDTAVGTDTVAAAGRVDTVLAVVVVDMVGKNWAQAAGLGVSMVIVDSSGVVAAMTLDGTYCSAVSVVRRTVGGQTAASDSRSAEDIAVDLPRRAVDKVVVRLKV